MLAVLESLRNILALPPVGPRPYIQGCDEDLRSKDPALDSISQVVQFEHRPFTVIVLFAIPVPSRSVTPIDVEYSGSCSPDERRGLTVTSNVEISV